MMVSWEIFVIARVLVELCCARYGTHPPPRCAATKAGAGAAARPADPPWLTLVESPLVRPVQISIS